LNRNYVFVTYENVSKLELKACEYCQTDFEPKRKDHKYCTDGCRSKAYLDRKYATNITGAPGPPEAAKKQQPRSRHSISENQLNALLVGQRSNSTVLQGLLSEKDSSGDLKATNAELKANLRYLQRDLQQEVKENQRLNDLVSKLQNLLDSKGESKLDKLVNGFAENPQGILETCIHGLHSIRTGQIPAGNLAPSGEPNLMSELKEIASMFPGADMGQLIQMVKAYAVANQEEISNTLNQNNSES